jgi:hypothetical protein
MRSACVFICGKPTYFPDSRTVYGSGYGDVIEVDKGNLVATVAGQKTGKDDYIIKDAIEEGRPVYLFHRAVPSYTREDGTKGGKPFVCFGKATRTSVTKTGMFRLEIDNVKPVRCGHHKGSWFAGGLVHLGVDVDSMNRRFMTSFYDVDVPSSEDAVKDIEREEIFPEENVEPMTKKIKI